MTYARQRLGRRAEELVARRLRSAGWRTVGRNVLLKRSKLDLVAPDKLIQSQGVFTYLNNGNGTFTQTSNVPIPGPGNGAAMNSAQLAKLYEAIRNLRACPKQAAPPRRLLQSLAGDRPSRGSQILKLIHGLYVLQPYCFLLAADLEGCNDRGCLRSFKRFGFRLDLGLRRSLRACWRW